MTRLLNLLLSSECHVFRKCGVKARYGTLGEIIVVKVLDWLEKRSQLVLALFVVTAEAAITFTRQSRLRAMSQRRLPQPLEPTA